MRLWLPTPAPNAVEPLSASLCVLSCPGWQTIKAASVLLAAVVTAEYKTNDHFVRRGSQIHNGGAISKVTGSESKVRLQLVNVK